MGAGLNKTVYIAGTFDTKACELGFIQKLLAAHGINTCTVDLSTGNNIFDNSADIKACTIAAYHASGPSQVFTGDRGTATAGMASAFKRYISEQNDVAGVLGLGGSGGTAVISPAFQQIPIGIPKVIVSTMASGNIAPYIGSSDICMMYSVTDIGGLNPILERVLANAVHALVGMLQHTHGYRNETAPVVGMTMFGVTTPCVETIRTQLEPGYSVTIFHATGAGGNSMENLVENDLVVGVIDVTTTEIADHLMGGILSAGSSRMDVFTRKPIPYVGSCGALDIVNFGARDSVPVQYQGRQFLQHNQYITLMRTSPEENTLMGEWIGGKLSRFKGPARFLIPEGGFSTLDAVGQPFYDPIARQALIKALSGVVENCGHIKLVCLPYHINDSAFSEALKRNFMELCGEY